MDREEFAKILFDEILFTICNLQQEHKDFTVHLPEFVEIDSQRFFYEDVYSEGIERGFEFGGDLNVMHNGEVKNAADLLNG